MRAVISKLNLTCYRHLLGPNHHTWLGTISTYPVQIIQYRRKWRVFFGKSTFLLSNSRAANGCHRYWRSMSGSPPPSERNPLFTVPGTKGESSKYYSKHIRKTSWLPTLPPTQTPRSNPELPAWAEEDRQRTWAEIGGRKTGNEFKPRRINERERLRLKYSYSNFHNVICKITTNRQ